VTLKPSKILKSEFRSTKQIQMTKNQKILNRDRLGLNPVYFGFRYSDFGFWLVIR
jgi:hypothetical protein